MDNRRMAQTVCDVIKLLGQLSILLVNNNFNRWLTLRHSREGGDPVARQCLFPVPHAGN
jgi:hypothetical protein